MALATILPTPAKVGARWALFQCDNPLLAFVRYPLVTKDLEDLPDFLKDLAS